jgi:SAM-dependent methyltransferase
VSLTDDGRDANERWAVLLAGWAIPDHLVAAAPESPYFFNPSVFSAAADAAIDRAEDTPSDSIARGALPTGGTVLDVGVGAGAASVRLRPAHITGVDLNPQMLDAFIDQAEKRGIATTAICGRWPDIASTTPVADLAVCHHVAYNVGDLAGFASALTAHTRRRVVMEFTAVHPLAWMAPYWKALHGLAQPDGPTADDAVAVLRGLGLAVQQQRWQRPIEMIGEHAAHAVDHLARRLCLPADRRHELEDLLRRLPPPATRDVATVWWDHARSA